MKKRETAADRAARTEKLGRAMDRAYERSDAEGDRAFDPWFAALMAEYAAGDHGEGVFHTTRTAVRRRAS